MGQIQAATFAANYAADKERSEDIVKGGAEAAEIGMDIASNSYFSAGFKGSKLAGETINHLVKNADDIDDEFKKINEWNKKYDSQGRGKKKSSVAYAILLI